MTDYMEVYRRWLDSPALTESEWKELSGISENEDEIKSRFFAPLGFGTAGLRGVMGVGINRMNSHVVKHTTQAFAELICDVGENAMKKGVVICYDCRNGSESFAQKAAGVMAANGIRVKLFDGLRPTPELSFAIRSYGAVAGINITASHNSKEYNGYKVYWSDGAQLPPQQAQTIAVKMTKIDIFTGVKCMAFDEAMASGLIEILGEKTDNEFLESVLSQAINPEVVRLVADGFKVVFTPFHGAGHKLVPEALRRLGLKHIIPVPEQMLIDGDFPTVESPNPENPEGFALAVALAKKENSDLVIGTDPDSDRVGVMARGADGEFYTISGNMMGVLLLDYIICARRAAGTLPENAAVLKTIVTTEMTRVVAQRNDVHIEDTFTGFKFMAEKLSEYEEAGGTYRYLLAFEESYGYMMGDFVRDKDAVTASMMIAEMAAHYYSLGMTLLQAQELLYEKYGYFAEKTLNIVLPGIDGLEKMKKLMADLRKKPPTQLCGVSVLRQRDYSTGWISVPGLGLVGNTPISGSDVLYFELEDESCFIIRPSGTEPKIKIYILVQGENHEECGEKVEKYAAYAKNLNT